MKKRKCKKSDYSFIYRISKEILFKYVEKYYKLDKEKFDQSFFRDYKNIIILFRGKRRIGFYQVKPCKEKLEIIKIFFSPSYQGKGLGKDLMNSFEKLGYKKISLQVWENNPAITFYKKLGYKIIKKENHKIHMEKKLK